ncbi:MAG: hemolysin family protein [Coriobacteriia bacterium]|jgi:putative hemolysin|nr:hemolysin family protein [Coriobacteriia bacterium]
MKDYATELLLVIGLIVLNGYFAASEIALISARRAALRSQADTGSAGAKAALELTDDPSRLLATIQVGITLVGFLASATAAVSLAAPLAEWFRGLNNAWLASVAHGLAILLVTLGISYLTLVFGELAPKRLGLQRAESVSVKVARPVLFLARIMAPVVWVLSRSTNLAARMLGVKGSAARSGITEEEIKLLVTEQGTLLDEEKRMIHEIFELGDAVAREVMMPRVDVVFLTDDATVADAIEIFRTRGFSRLPVVHGDADQVVGLVLLKDLVAVATEGRLSEPVTTYLRSPVFVPETKPLLALLSEMQRTRNHMVVVVDEYGGTAGIVTIEDIVEEIIGEVVDEFDPDLAYVTTIAPDRWVLDGRLPVEDAAEMGLPVEESDEYETLAGWLLVQLGYIPVPGEQVTVENVTFRVQAVRRRRIARVLVTRQEEPNVVDEE